MNRSREYRFETGFENNRENREDFLICEIETAREMTKARRNIGRWIELATAQLKRSAFFPFFFRKGEKKRIKHVSLADKRPRHWLFVLAIFAL